MKKALLLSFALMLVAGVAFGQAGSIGIFADPVGANCNLIEAPPLGLKMYYVVHVYCPGATASQYRAKVPLCMTAAIWLSDTNMFPVAVGNSQIGFSTGYGACKVSPIHTQIINVFGQGLTGPCCRWFVDADPLLPSGQIEVSDCGFNVIYATGGQGIVNPNGTCQCNVPTEDTTWGQVKALYE